MGREKHFIVEKRQIIKRKKKKTMTLEGKTYAKIGQLLKK